MIKKALIVLIGIFMLFATVMGAMAMEIQTGDDIGEIPMIDLQMGELNKPSFWSNFKLQPFVFVDTTASQSRTSGDFRVLGTHGAFGLITNGRYASGSWASAGARCNSGEYIRLFEYEKQGDKFVYKRDLFENIYLKESANDNIAFSRYWIKDFSGHYGYACLERIRGSDNLHFEYYCRNGAVSSSDDTAGNFNCPSNVCKTSGITVNNKQSRTQLESALCQAVSNRPAIEIIEAKPSKSTYEVGDRVIIQGVAKINRDVTGGVIESSLIYRDYVRTQPLSVISRTSTDKGVCGDDFTTGVTFNAKAGDTVAFTLRMTSKESGRYTVKVISAEGCGKGILTEQSVSFRVNPTTQTTPSPQPDQDDKGAVCPDGTYNCHFDFDDDDRVNDGNTPINPIIDDNIGDIGDIPSTGGNTVTKTPNLVPGVPPPTRVTRFGILISGYFDYKNNPMTAYGLTAMIVLILVMLGYVMFGTSKKGGKF